MRIRSIFLLIATVSLSAQFKSDVRLVEVYASVFDRKGLPVDDLKKERFRVLDEGRPQPIVSFEQASDPLSCAILIDTTGSMRESLGSVRNAVSNLLGQIRPEDAVAIFSFSTSLVKLQDFTTDKSTAKRALTRLRAGGETALFDAISDVSREIAPRSGKKAIVLFTDGADNASRLVAGNAIDRAVKTGIPIYAVAEGDATREGQLLRQLRSLATQTGGLCYPAKNTHELAKIFADIQAELRHMYLLSYTPPKGDDTKWRSIRIDIDGGSDYKIRGKQGYFPD
jgi:VWFA-related protein